MKSSKLKILILVLLVVIAGVLGTIYYASTKISPQEVRRITLEMLEKSFPNAQIELGDVGLSFGTSFKLRVAKLHMNLKEGVDPKKSELVKLDSLDVKVPLWAILTQGGKVDVTVDRPEMVYREYSPGKNNWTLAMGKSEAKMEAKAEKEAETLARKESSPKEGSLQPPAGDSSKSTLKNLSDDQTKSAPEKVVLPAFLARSTVNIKFTNIALHYQLKSNEKGTIQVSRFLVKNLNLKGSTAFELASTIESVTAKGEKIGAEALLIGQVNLQEYLEGKGLESSMLLTLSNIVVPGNKKELPSIKVEVKSLLEQTGDIRGQVLLNLGSIGNAKAHLALSNQEIELTQIDVELLVKELMNLVPQQNVHEMVNAANAKMRLQGKVSVSQAKKIQPALEFVLTPGMTLKPHSRLIIGPEARGSFHGDKLTLSFNGKTLEGNINAELSTKINLQSKKFSMEDLGPTKVNIRANDLKLSQDLLQELLYKPKEESKEKPTEKITGHTSEKSGPSNHGGPVNNKENNASQKKGEVAPAASVAKSSPPVVPVLPNMVANIEWSNLSIGGEPFGGSATIVSKKHTIASEKVKFEYSKGKGEIKFLVDMISPNEVRSNLGAQIGHLNLGSFRPLLPPKVLEGIEGTFTGNINGHVVSFPKKKVTQYDFVIDVKAENGEIKRLNLTDSVKDLVSSIPVLKGKIEKKGLNFSNKFDDLSLNGRFQTAKFDIKRFYFVGGKKMVELTGFGTIYPLPQSPQSVLEFEFLDKSGKVSEELDKATGTKYIPIKLEGPQYTLKPDFNYTLGRLAKKGVKTQAKKELNKLKDKFLKENKEDVKKLLKGLFR